MPNFEDHVFSAQDGHKNIHEAGGHLDSSRESRDAAMLDVLMATGRKTLSGERVYGSELAREINTLISKSEAKDDLPKSAIFEAQRMVKVLPLAEIGNMVRAAQSLLYEDDKDGADAWITEIRSKINQL